MIERRNYGDPRIVEFDRQARDWQNAPVDPLHRNNHLYHAERYRRLAERFRNHHANDPYWVAKEELPE